MILLALALASAHAPNPAALRAEPVDGGWRITWRTPDATAGVAVEPGWPACPEVGAPVTRVDRPWAAVEVVRTFRCADASVRIPGDAAVVEVVRDGVASRSVVAGGADVRLAAPPTRGWTGAAQIGAAHLLAGADHALLVVALALRARGLALVRALTAFTVGHAASLALATLGALGPWPGVEPLIAATLVLACADAVGGAPGPLRARPWLVGVPVGLVHGLGFAGGLAGAGLAREGVVTGLLGFNLGLEVAQLAVAAGTLGALAALDAVGFGEGARRGVAWAGGVVAAAWLFERLT